MKQTKSNQQLIQQGRACFWIGAFARHDELEACDRGVTGNDDAAEVFADLYAREAEAARQQQGLVGQEGGLPDNVVGFPGGSVGFSRSA